MGGAISTLQVSDNGSWSRFEAVFLGQGPELTMVLLSQLTTLLGSTFFSLAASCRRICVNVDKLYISFRVKPFGVKPLKKRIEMWGEVVMQVRKYSTGEIRDENITLICHAGSRPAGPMRRRMYRVVTRYKDYAFMQAEELGIKVYRPPTEMWGAYLTSDDEDSSDVRHVYRLVTYTPRGLGSSSIAIALNDFTPTLGRWDYKNFEICLPLREGDRLRVTRHGTNGWMQGVRASTGEKGWFPTSYVRVDKRAWNMNWLRRFDMSVVKGMTPARKSLMPV